MNDNMNNEIVNKSEDELFYFVGNDFKSSEKIVAPRYSYWKSVFRAFFRKKSNIVLLSLLALILICSFVLPIFLKYTSFENNTKLDTKHLSPKKAMAHFGGYSFKNLKWILGTDQFGNSVFYQVFTAARTSLLIAIICAAINMFIGIVIGAIWGYSKKFDAVMLVIYNIIANVPFILLITVVIYIIGSGFWQFIFALTITGWLSIAYFFRTQVMIIRDREYSLASRCLGTPIYRVVPKNILPFLTSVIVTILATELPSYISYEVYLSYLGAGLSSKIASLGQMISSAQTTFLTYPWEFWTPVSIAAAITIILYVLGQNLADASDPRTHM